MLKNLILKLFNRVELEKLGGAQRSPQWPKLRKEFLKGKVCRVCGGIENLTPHHKFPVHLFPQLELVESNLIALCERKKVLNCHLIIGHLGNFKRYNPNAVEDIEIWNKKLK